MAAAVAECRLEWSETRQVNNNQSAADVLMLPIAASDQHCAVSVSVTFIVDMHCLVLSCCDKISFNTKLKSSVFSCVLQHTQESNDLVLID